MEPHGDNSLQQVVAIIPARYRSVRLPGKLMMEIAGKPMIVHTMQRAGRAQSISRVLVATDDDRIFDAVTAAGGEAVMTSGEHTSGSDRVAEAATGLAECSIVVNVQGDEPLISPDTIDAVVETLMGDDRCDIATAAEPIDRSGHVLDPNVVKVVTDLNGYALYFSRSPIPFWRDGGSADLNLTLESKAGALGSYRKHTGLYAYRRETLLRFAGTAPSKLERAEMLEQLRALENGFRIKVVDAAETSIGVDTADDLERVRRLFEAV